jgi:hypothetical protein
MRALWSGQPESSKSSKKNQVVLETFEERLRSRVSITFAVMLATATSKNGIPIRLTAERWAHITEEHGELEGMRQQVLDTISDPLCVYPGNAGELLAIRELEMRKWLVAVYRELGEDGFLITAFLTRRISSLERRKQLWP